MTNWISGAMTLPSEDHTVLDSSSECAPEDEYDCDCGHCGDDEG